MNFAFLETSCFFNSILEAINSYIFDRSISLDIKYNSSRTLFFISLAALFVNVRAKIFLYVFSSFISSVRMMSLTNEKVFPEPALALIIFMFGSITLYKMIYVILYNNL